MYSILNRYLFQHKSLPVPGIGTIYLETGTASIDSASRMAIPPTHQLRFDRYFDAPDKSFFAYLAQQQNIADYESLRQYNEFAYRLRDQLNLQQSAEWNGLGVLYKDEEGNILLRSDFLNPSFLEPVSATKVVRSDAQHTMLVGDQERTSDEMLHWFSEEADSAPGKWWLPALVTGIAAVLLILFHLSSHGWKMDAAGNQQILQTEK